MKFKISGGKLGNNVVESGSVNVGGIKVADIVDTEIGVIDDGNKIIATETPVSMVVKDERPKNKKVEEAIEIDPSLIKKNKPSLTDILRDAIDELNGGAYHNVDEEEKEVINKLIISLINNLVSIINEEADYLPIGDMKELVNAIGQSYIKLYSIIDYEIGEVEDDDLRPDLPELDIEDTSLTFKKNILYNIFKDKSFKLAIENNDEDNTVTPIIYYNIPGINKCDNLLFSPIYGDKYDIAELAEDYIESQKVKDKEVTEEVLSKAEELLSSSIVEDVIDDDAKNDNINDVAKFAAEIINIKDVLPERDPQKILVILDEDGEYITVGDGDTLLAIDNIDGRDLDKITIVSKSWFDNITSNSKDTIPVGVVPESKVSFSVNGVDED